MTLIFLIVLISDAFPQYIKLTRGQPNPFDTAVAVRIDRYRIEGKKLALGQKLVDSLLSEIQSLHQEIRIGDSLNIANDRNIAILSKSVERKDSVNAVILQNFEKLYAIKEDKWYEQPGYYFAAFIVYELIKMIF